MSVKTITVHTWWITCIWVIWADSVIFFAKNKYLDNRRFPGASVKVLTSVSLLQCAGHCHNISPCLSLVYNGNGTCELLTRVYIDPEDTVTLQGSRTLKKGDDDQVCGLPTTITKGRVLYTDGQMDGSKAEFVCDDFHIPTTEAGICDTSGKWVGLDNPCQQRLIPPYIIPANGKLQTGSRLVVMATPTADTIFYFSLARGNTDVKSERDVYFHFAARFTSPRYRDFARNAKFNRRWGRQEHSVKYWPFVVNQEFNLTVCVEETMYRVYVDHDEMFTFSFRGPVYETMYVIIERDVSLRKIRFYNTGKSHCVYPCWM